MLSQTRVCAECEGTGIFTLISHRGIEGLYRELIDCPGCQGSGVEAGMLKLVSRWSSAPESKINLVE
ncbi:hypothetical protein DU002_07230 [Corallincola holothuriorum]|uniref:Uncharacterized protein n=1 Tax=Corallincola holothuriorum TaxID=2282215 RepID=A0A368NKY3_9GAMM|nr:hypothetical protein [Corallincola holothuriorum]RCU51098.1 hypothetical protein DU002_07230 [Corallincola holothuriorum]